MHHAILGAGGVGGLIGAALGKDGDRITLLLRPSAVSQHPSQLSLESKFGNVTVPVERATTLTEAVDVLWITVKATQFEDALKAIPANGPRIGAIVPLLNGVDHIEVLRSRFGKERVVAATIAVESERVAPGKIGHRSPFARLNVSSVGRDRLSGVLDRLSRFGFECKFWDDEITMMWSKLVFLGPLALTTSASGESVGPVLATPVWHNKLQNCVREACAVAIASGAKVDPDKVLSLFPPLPAGMKSSMQKDVEAHRTPELDAIAGPIIHHGKQLGIPVPTTQELVQRIEARLALPTATRAS